MCVYYLQCCTENSAKHIPNMLRRAKLIAENIGEHEKWK